MAYFNPLRPSYIADPYPALARLRAEAPVFYSEPHEAWIVTSYAAAAFRALFDRLTALRLASGTVFPRGPDWILRSAGAVPLLTGDLFRR